MTTPPTLATLERALGKGQRLFSPSAVRELVFALRRLESENAGLQRSLAQLVAELELQRRTSGPTL